MQEHAAPFHYPLAPLLKRDVWERDILGLEVQRAGLALEEAERQLLASAAHVAAAELRMRELHRENQTIALEARRMLQLYLHEAYARKASCQAGAQRAAQVLEQVRAQLESKRLAVKTLEKHRERGVEAHEQVQARRLQRVADELWLVRRR